MSIVREFERAFNRQDVSVPVACFTPDGSYHDTFFGGRAGADQLRAMFDRMFREGREYTWTMETDGGGDGRVRGRPVDLRLRGESEAIPRSAGRRVRFHGMSLFEKRGGRIAAYRESFDLGVALLQLGFSPEATAKTIRRHRL